MKNERIYALLSEFYNHQEPVGASTLKNTLNMSQTSIGRALVSLENLGFLEKVSNKGRIITSKGILWYEKETALLDKQSIANDLIQGQKNTSITKLKEAIYVRKLLEPQAAGLACMNATDEDLERLVELINKYIDCISKAQEADDIDLKIHLRIAELSGNKTLFMLLTLLLTEDKTYMDFSKVALPTFKPENSATLNHSEILRAVITRDSQAASEAMLKHLEKIEDALDIAV